MVVITYRKNSINAPAKSARNALQDFQQGHVSAITVKMNQLRSKYGVNKITTRKNSRSILRSRKKTGKKAITTRAIAEKADLSVNGISQSLGAMRNFKLINSESRNGGDWTWEIEDDGV